MPFKLHPSEGELFVETTLVDPCNPSISQGLMSLFISRKGRFVEIGMSACQNPRRNNTSARAEGGGNTAYSLLGHCKWVWLASFRQTESFYSQTKITKHTKKKCLRLSVAKIPVHLQHEAIHESESHLPEDSKDGQGAQEVEETKPRQLSVQTHLKLAQGRTCSGNLKPGGLL